MDATIDTLARQILPPEQRASFLALDTRAKLVGLATLAHWAHDNSVRDACLRALTVLQQHAA